MTTDHEQAGRELFGDQTCTHCREQHPGQTCPLEDLAQPLPLE